MPDMQEYKNIDEYIANFPDNVQKILEKLRALVKEVAPEAKEEIAYGIPTFKLNGKNLVHFGAYPKHIGLYPGPPMIIKFADELKNYKTSKGTVQFQLDEPIPYRLIKEITEACAAERDVRTG